MLILFNNVNMIWPWPNVPRLCSEIVKLYTRFFFFDIRMNCIKRNILHPNLALNKIYEFFSQFRTQKWQYGPIFFHLDNVIGVFLNFFFLVKKNPHDPVAVQKVDSLAFKNVIQRWCYNYNLFGIWLFSIL